MQYGIKSSQNVAGLPYCETFDGGFAAAVTELSKETAGFLGDTAGSSPDTEPLLPAAGRLRDMLVQVYETRKSGEREDTRDCDKYDLAQTSFISWL